MTIDKVDLNGRHFTLPRAVDTLKICYDGVRPITMTMQDMRTVVEELATNVYFEEIWTPDGKTSYNITITDPTAIGRSIDEFSGREAARFHLAKLIKDTLSVEMDYRWHWKMVDELPAPYDHPMSIDDHCCHRQTTVQWISDSVAVKQVHEIHDPKYCLNPNQPDQWVVYALHSDWSDLELQSE